MGQYLLPYARLRPMWNGFSVHVHSVHRWLPWLMENYLANDARNAKALFQGKYLAFLRET